MQISKVYALVSLIKKEFSVKFGTDEARYRGSGFESRKHANEPTLNSKLSREGWRGGEVEEKGGRKGS